MVQSIHLHNYFASSIKPESGSLIDQSGDNIQKTQPAENNSSRDLP
jgi:hypothetical protein